MSNNFSMVYLWTHIGITLFKVQLAEAALKASIVWLDVSPDETIEAMESRIEALRKKTIGHFIHKLRSKVDVSAQFEETLTKFLANRNLFAHDFRAVPGFSIETQQEIEVGIEFAMALRKQAESVFSTICGFNSLFANSGQLDREVISNPPTLEQIREITALLHLKLK